jgi:hypothetical protein
MKNLQILEYIQKGQKINTKEDFHIYTHPQSDHNDMFNTAQTQNFTR